MLIILNCIILLVCIFTVIFNKKISTTLILVFIITLLLLVFQIINFVSQTRKITLSEEFLENLLMIDWEKEEELINLGFEYETIEKYYYLLYETGKEKRIRVFVTFVQENNEVPSGFNSYKNISYEASENRPSIFWRLFYGKKYLTVVVRRYVLYINGIQIRVTEDNVLDSQLEFEKYFMIN